ncbi:MAG TPA: hypothetical protein DEA73_06725 [Peptococcaceae bacterium]|nr:hypothetical protein [Peptococcaceae bacterium]
MALTAVASNVGNRFSTRYQEVSIICLVQEYLVLQVTVRSDLLLPCLGSRPKQEAQPMEIARMSVRRLIDSCWLNNFRELVWGYFAAGRPTPAPPLRVISCQFVPITVNCVLIPLAFTSRIGLSKVTYEYKLVITYEDRQGVTGQAEVNSGPLVSALAVNMQTGARCQADLQVSVLDTRIVEGDPLPGFGPLPISPSAAVTLKEVVSQQWRPK